MAMLSSSYRTMYHVIVARSDIPKWRGTLTEYLEKNYGPAKDYGTIHAYRGFIANNDTLRQLAADLSSYYGKEIKAL